MRAKTSQTQERGSSLAIELSTSSYSQKYATSAVANDLYSVVLDLHQKLDGLEEAELGGGKIGTTGKGIGPCYSSKASRSGIRIADVFREEVFAEKVRKLA